MQTPQITWLPDGRRLHLHHGPIDMIVDVQGPGRVAGLKRAACRFQTLLTELVEELPELREQYAAECYRETARLMQNAVRPFAPEFVTPMAAVAGAGADTILSAILDGEGIETAHVNNGGDIAFHVSAGHTLKALVASDPVAHVRFHADDPMRGMATSGHGGRSYSLGIADSVTVMAKSAAVADVAATLVANRVDVPGHANIERVPANRLSPDSDLGARLVTVRVGSLSEDDIRSALHRGETYANGLRQRGLIHAAYLTLRGQSRTVGTLSCLDQRDVIHA